MRRLRREGAGLSRALSVSRRDPGEGHPRLRARAGDLSLQDAKSERTKTRTVSGAKFLWLILQHVLPKGFRRMRNFGFLHPNSKRLVAVLQSLFASDPRRASTWIKPRPRLACPCCGGDMMILGMRIIPSLSDPPLAPIGDVADAAVM
jgi:hypothetical protein